MPAAPLKLERLKESLAKDEVKLARLADIEAALQEQNPAYLTLQVDYEEALEQVDMALLGGMKRKAACAAAATAVLYNAKPQPEMVGHQADAKPQPETVGHHADAKPQLEMVGHQQAESTGDNSIWTALAEFHAALTDYPKVRAYFIDGDLWDSKGRLICKASVGGGLASTLRLDPLDPRSGLVACLVPTFYSGLFEALLVGLFGGGVLSVVLGALAAYTISAAIYLAIVKSTDSVSADPVEAAFADTDCTFSAYERFQYGAIAVAALLLFDLVLAFQARTGPLTSPYYALKAALAGLMLVHAYKLHSEMKARSGNTGLYMA